MGDTSIEWTRNADGTPGKTWNPIRARNKETGKAGWFCEHVSEGCRNCYAGRMNINTYFGNGLEYKPAVLDQVELFLDENILQQPLRWRKPCNVFPCSMTDLFGRWVPDEWIDRIFAVMTLAPQHTFQVLTKRPERMLRWCQTKDSPLDGSRADIVMERAAWIGKVVWDARGNQPEKYLRATKESVANRRAFPGWPLPNVWLGTSCEDQKTADERIPLLMETPAAVRWISAEPLLGQIDLESVPTMEGSIDWVVCGGESGPKARPMHPDWARSLRDQCVAAGVPFFFKQWGEFMPLASVFNDDDQMFPVAAATADQDRSIAIDGSGGIYWNQGDEPPVPQSAADAYVMSKVGKKEAGRLLDSVEWNQFPETGQ